MPFLPGGILLAFLWSVKILIFSFLLVGLVSAEASVSSLKCRGFTAPRKDPLHHAFLWLQNFKEGLLVNQKAIHHQEMRGQHGACGAATVVNFVQGVFRVLGFEPIAEPVQLVDQIYQSSSLFRQGMVSNFAMFKEVRKILKQKLPTPIETRVDYFLPFHDPKPIKGWASREEMIPSLLESKPGEFKILAYAVYSPSGVRIGRHFVVLTRSLEQDSISVIDPNKPNKSHQYDVLPVEFQGGTSLQLVRPGGPYVGARQFILDSVFTFRFPEI